MKQKNSYMKFRFMLGLVTLLAGIWSANMALFNWIERTGVYYLLSAYARYICAYGGFIAMISGAMLVNDFLAHRNVLKSKSVTEPKITKFCNVEKKEKMETLSNQRHKNATKAVTSFAIFLFMSSIIVVYGTVSYAATVVIAPKIPIAFAYYRSNSGSNLLTSCKERIWDGSSWSSEEQMPSSGSSIRFVRVAICPLKSRWKERVVVTLSADGYLDAYVWNGSSWLVTNNIAYSGTTANAYRCFDVAYEKASGRALLVYSRGTATNEIGYKIWDGVSWSSEQLLNLPYTTGVVYWIALATAPGTRSGTVDDNEIAMIYIDANVNVHGYIWTGSAWSGMGATGVWDNTAAIATEECIAVGYEQVSGRAVFVWGDSVATNNYYRIWNGSTLGAITPLQISAQGGVTNWVTLKSDPASDGLLYMVIDSGYNLNTAYWSGSAWTVHSEHDAAVDTHARRCADFEWEPSGGKGLLVWGTSSGSLSFKTFTVPSTWSSASTITAAGRHPWVQLRRNTKVTDNVRILGAMLNSNNDLGALKWDGSTLTNLGDSAFTSDTTVVAYECFEIAFSNKS